MTYRGGNFNSPQIFIDSYGQWGDNGVYAADVYTCPYNTSDLEEEYSDCQTNDTVSEYMDPNVDESTYLNCAYGWIKDGVCM